MYEVIADRMCTFDVFHDNKYFGTWYKHDGQVGDDMVKCLRSNMLIMDDICTLIQCQINNVEDFTNHYIEDIEIQHKPYKIKRRYLIKHLQTAPVAQVYQETMPDMDNIFVGAYNYKTNDCISVASMYDEFGQVLNKLIPNAKTKAMLGKEYHIEMDFVI